jgi:hypothetical protein
MEDCTDSRSATLDMHGAGTGTGVTIGRRSEVPFRPSALVLYSFVAIKTGANALENAFEIAFAFANEVASVACPFRFRHPFATSLCWWVEGVLGLG